MACSVILFCYNAPSAINCVVSQVTNRCAQLDVPHKHVDEESLARTDIDDLSAIIATRRTSATAASFLRQHVRLAQGSTPGGGARAGELALAPAAISAVNCITDACDDAVKLASN